MSVVFVNVGLSAEEKDYRAKKRISFCEERKEFCYDRVEDFQLAAIARDAERNVRSHPRCAMSISHISFSSTLRRRDWTFSHVIRRDRRNRNG